MSAKVVPKGGLVLVTGVNGFIGSHVADQLLKNGYRVRGTARDQEKADYILEYFDGTYGKGKAEVIVVKDMSSFDAFDEAAKGVDGVAHVASDMSFGNDADKVVSNTVKGISNALTAAAKNPSVKSFVLTSSSVAITFPYPNQNKHLSASDWNEDSLDKAWSLPDSDPLKGFHVYSASKVSAEREAWKFVKENKPQFTLNTIQPNFNVGKILHPKQQGSSGSWVTKIYEGNKERIQAAQKFPPQHMVDVEEVALLHVAALTQPDVQSERLLAFAHPMSYGQLLEVFAKVDPSVDLPQETSSDRDTMTFDTKRSQELLKRYGRDGWSSFEQSVRKSLGKA